MPLVSINSQAFLKANLFQPLLGSGMKKLPLIKRNILSLNESSLLFAKPAVGIFDLSFWYILK
jgi:hypothetical protein